MAKHGSPSVSFGVSFLKGASEERGWGGGERNENKNKFEKLKANRSQSKERQFVPKCKWKNLLGVFAMRTWATTMPVLVGILKQFLCLLFLLREWWGCQIQSVISEHFKRLIVAAIAKMFKFIIMFWLGISVQQRDTTPDSRSCFYCGNRENIGP